MPKLLVVDDDPVNLEIIGDFLGDQHGELSYAADGEKAWECLSQHPEQFDLVILDRMMPQLSGMEVLERIKADPRFAALPVIMQTASAAPEEIAEGLAAGAWYYLAKPYNEIALNSVVRAALKDRWNHQELARLSGESRRMLALLQQGTFRFRSPDEARQLASALGECCPNGGGVALGLLELMMNAIEHGNLGMGYEEKSRLLADGSWQDEIERRLATPEQRARSAELTYQRQPDRLLFTIVDQGAGFDWSGYLDMDPARAFDSHGRGIVLARQMAFTALEYQGRGNIVTATILIDAGAVDT